MCPLADDLKDPSLKVPHIGWNRLDIVPGRENDPLFKYTKPGEYVYYVHSFYAKNCAANTLAASEYSIPVTGAVKTAWYMARSSTPKNPAIPACACCGPLQNCEVQP